MYRLLLSNLIMSLIIDNPMKGSTANITGCAGINCGSLKVATTMITRSKCHIHIVTGAIDKTP